MNLLWSRNGITLLAILAFVTFAWAKGEKALQRHDARVSREAVQQITEKSRAKVDKAKVAQRRVDPASADGVLASRYCSDCAGGGKP